MVTVDTTVQKEVELPDLAEPLVRRAVRRVLRDVSELDCTRRYAVDVTFVHEDTMRELNLKYRDRDSPTDVLSFPLLCDEEARCFPLPPPDDVNHLGDVIVCPTEISSGTNVLRELAFLACHGALHLVGWTHEDTDQLQKMNRLTGDALAHVFPPEL